MFKLGAFRTFPRWHCFFAREGTRLQLVTLPLERIRQHPRQARGLRSLDSVANLSASINEVGLLHPVIVQRDGDGYRLVAGYRRLLAAARAGKTEIPALVLSGPADALQVQLAENLQREDLNPLERAMAVQAFMEEQQLSVRAAAQNWAFRGRR
jgi:ParB-like partition proteins